MSSQFTTPVVTEMQVIPALSVSTTILRVKYALCAPPILSNMLSCPATGMTFISVITGLDCVAILLPRNRFQLDTLDIAHQHQVAQYRD
jgi:hypothetical protein